MKPAKGFGVRLFNVITGTLACCGFLFPWFLDSTLAKTVWLCAGVLCTFLFLMTSSCPKNQGWRRWHWLWTGDSLNDASSFDNESPSAGRDSVTLSQFLQILAFMILNGINAFFYLSMVPVSSRYTWWSIVWVLLTILAAWGFFRHTNRWQTHKAAT